MESEKVTKKQFVSDVSQVFGVLKENIFDFYGFTEQMGLLYVSVGDGPKTVSTYSEIIIRDFQVRYDAHFSAMIQKIIKIVDCWFQSFFELYFWLPTESFFS